MGKKTRAVPSRELMSLEERRVERLGPATFPGDPLGNKVASLEAQVGSLKELFAEQRGRAQEEERRYTRDIASGTAARGWVAICISAGAMILAILSYFKK